MQSGRKLSHKLIQSRLSFVRYAFEVYAYSREALLLRIVDKLSNRARPRVWTAKHLLEFFAIPEFLLGVEVIHQRHYANVGSGGSNIIGCRSLLFGIVFF